MRAVTAALVAAFLLAGCSSSAPKEVHACFEEYIGGRLLHDPGVIVGEHDDAQGHWIDFQGQYWPHPIPVRKVNRACPLASSLRGVSVNDYSAMYAGADHSAPPAEGDPQP